MLHWHIKRPARDTCLCMGDLQAPHFVFLIVFSFSLLVYYSDMYYVDKDYTKTIKVIPSPIWAYKSL